MKRIIALIALVITFALSLTLFACDTNKDSAVDHGVLTITDITMNQGETKDITPKFSKDSYEITYSFEGDAISIANGKVTANGADTTVEVTATTAHHSVTFTVTILDNVDRGTLEINDIYAWVNYPASDFYLHFSKPEYAEEVEFIYDDACLYIDQENFTVEAYVEGDYRVTATSEHFSKTFTVRAERVDQDSSKFSAGNFYTKATARESSWKKAGKDGSTTIFIGDSFFDDFWSNFHTEEYYAGKDALRLGISSTTSYDWETWINGWLGETNPANIVMHMGTNNVYDDGDDDQTLVSSLQRMFTMMHAKLPNTKIYWFSITQRSYDLSKRLIVEYANQDMKKWCDERDYITYIHTVDSLTSDMLKDGIHPKPENYYVFRDALAQTDIVIADAAKSQGLAMESVAVNASESSFNKETGVLTATSPVAQNRAANYLVYNGDYYHGDFVISGTITASTANGWIALFVNSSPEDNWFDANLELPAAAIVFPAGNATIWGYKAGGANSSLGSISNIDFTNFNYSVVSYNDKVLWQIGNVCKEITLSADSAPYFGIVNETNSITATVKVDFEPANIADAYEKIKANEVVPDYSAKIDDVTNTTANSIGMGDGVFNVYYKSGALNRNFILEGKLDVTATAGNPHIQFGVDSWNNRVLLWDNETKGKFKLCMGLVNNNVPEEDVFTFKSGETLTIEWKIVMTDNDMYFFVNGELKVVMANQPDGLLVIGSESTACRFYEMSALTLTDDGDAYNTAIAEYEDIINTYKNVTENTRV